MAYKIVIAVVLGVILVQLGIAHGRKVESERIVAPRQALEVDGCTTDQECCKRFNDCNEGLTKGRE